MIATVFIQYSTKSNMRSIIVFLGLIGYVHSITYGDVLESEWNTFKTEYGKRYENENEEQLRRLIFRDNKEMIDKHNQLYIAGEVTYEMGVNQFTDLLSTEFESLMLPSLNITEYDSLVDFIYTPPENVELPSEIDWRSRGAVTEVKNQGKCGSCWAFPAVGTLEGQHFLKTNRLMSLSAQNLVDCASQAPYKNKGCDGGWPHLALQYIQQNGGIDTEDSYSYEAVKKACRFNKNNIGATLRGILKIKESEQILTAAIAIVGPISVGVDATHMQSYRSGVYDDPSCNHQVNHAVTVVGYGHDSKGGDYWLVKNSWGSGFGENGYIRMSRNKNNQCQIASYAFFPLV